MPLPNLKRGFEQCPQVAPYREFATGRGELWVQGRLAKLGGAEDGTSSLAPKRLLKTLWSRLGTRGLLKSRPPKPGGQAKLGGGEDRTSILAWEAASQRPWERCWAESSHEEPTPETKLLGGEKDVTAAPIPDDLLNLDTANLFAPWTETFETCSSDTDR